MTPIGHTAISYIAGKTIKKLSIPFLIIGGVLPDIDFVFVFASYFNQIHRLWTHNLAFGLVACFLLLLFKFQNKPVKILSLAIGILLHLLIDSMLDSNPSNGIGVAIFYPISNYYFSPINLSFIEPKTTWQNLPAMFWQTAKLFYIEIPVCIVAVLMFWKGKFKKA
jgi:membrane-bound metal-dependent hydrolase YbcI (DUF457 family)